MANNYDEGNNLSGRVVGNALRKEPYYNNANDNALGPLMKNPHKMMLFLKRTGIISSNMSSEEFKKTHYWKNRRHSLGRDINEEFMHRFGKKDDYYD